MITLPPQKAEHIVFVPGFGSSQAPGTVGYFLAALQGKGYPTHYVASKRTGGYADSHRNFPPALWDQAVHLNTFLANNNLTNVIAVGHSLGAAVALMAAHDQPARFARVDLVCQYGIAHMNPIHRSARFIHKVLGDIVQASPLTRDQEVRELTRLGMQGSNYYFKGALVRSLKEAVELRDPWVLHLLQYFDNNGTLPVRWLHTPADTITTQAAALKQARALRRVQCIELADVKGHDAHLWWRELAKHY